MAMPPGKNLFRPKKAVARNFLDLIQKELKLKEPNKKSFDTGRDLETRKLELRLLAELLLENQMREGAAKRSCFEWWCFGDKATDTTPAPPTTVPSTTPPAAPMPTTTKELTADEYQQLWDLLKQLLGSGLFG